MNIGIMNLGRAFTLGAEKGKRCHGDVERRGLIYSLSRLPNVENIVLMSRSDWQDIGAEDQDWMDPNEKVTDLWETIDEADWKANHANLTVDEQLEHVKFLERYLKDCPKVDFILAFKSTSAPLMLPAFMEGTRTEDEYVKVLGMIFQHISPQVWYLNKTKTPWYMILTDPRLMKSNQKETLHHAPLRILSQYEDTMNMRIIKQNKAGCTDEDIVAVPLEYASAESLAIAGDVNCVDPADDKPIQMTVIAMQSTIGSGPKDWRLQQLENYIVNQKAAKNVHIYGKWMDWRVSEYPHFKGYAPTEALDDRMAKSRYTFIVPVNDQWVTAKYAECLREGVLPFLHPGYDGLCLVFPEHHPVRVKSPQDLWKKVAYYDANPNERIALVRKLQKQLVKGEEFAGSFIDHLDSVLQDDLNLNLLQQ